MDPMWYVVVFLLAAIVGVLVTDGLCRSNTFWSTRVPGTRFRYANAPVGAAILTVASFFMDYPENGLTMSAAVALFVTAYGWAYVCPARNV